MTWGETIFHDATNAKKINKNKKIPLENYLGRTKIPWKSKNPNFYCCYLIVKLYILPISSKINFSIIFPLVFDQKTGPKTSPT